MRQIRAEISKLPTPFQQGNSRSVSPRQESPAGPQDSVVFGHSSPPLPTLTRNNSSTLVDNLGPGFPAAPTDRSSLAEGVHDWVSSRDPLGLYNKGVGILLDKVSDSTREGIGIDAQGLLQVERTLFRSLSSGAEGYQGNGSVPLFEALANGQACYVSLGPERQSEAEHMMLLFNNTPPEQLKDLPIADPELAKIRDQLVTKSERKEFPVFIDTDGDFDTTNATESILTGCLSSIAKRQNSLGADFPDPKDYYRWLLTRVESSHKKLDPWLFAAQPTTHSAAVEIKENLTPPWLEAPKRGFFSGKPVENNDPFGAQPSAKKIRMAYLKMMEVCGNGKAPDWNTLTSIADLTVNLDRDLVSGVQTYWVKLLSELSPTERGTLMAPVSRSWVNLNVLGPDHPQFGEVSPASSPMIELVDRHSGKLKLERYDRAQAMSQAVDHMINGLGLSQRREFLDTLMGDIRANQPALEAREARIRERLGASYSGLDVAALLRGDLDIRDPGVKEALGQLRAAATPDLSTHDMTPEYAELTRHRDMLDWVANRYARYGDSAFDWVVKSPRAGEFAKNPLIVSEYYTPTGRPAKGVTPLPAGPGPGELLGEKISGKDPLKMSVVFEGGGGKGFAYVDMLRQLDETLAKGPGEIQVDEFVGNSAGAITAGLLAAGYKGDELAKVLQDLDFTSFYSDYLWLAGGVDPKARGIDRTGLFSTQKMYQTISDLLQTKCGVEGRPVLFRDLPFKLRVTSTMINGDISPELRESLKLAPDGQVVFSDETSPNMDVAAAICSSAAIPGFFNSPQLQVCSGAENGKAKLSRMQMADGGVTNNFPITQTASDESSFMVMLPTSFQAPSPIPGGKPISLTTLDFNSADVVKIDAYNREVGKTFLPGLKGTLNEAADKGYGRAVLAMNLTSLGFQTQPVVQGQEREETLELLSVSARHGMPTYDAETGADKVKSNMQHKSRGVVERWAVDKFLDKDDHFQPWTPGPYFTPGRSEADGIGDVLSAVAAASFSSPEQLEKRLFEK